MIRALLAAIGLALLVGCGAHPVSAPAPFEDLVTTGPATGALVAHGVVRRGGRPVPGATVTLHVGRWASPAAVADEHGRWALDVDPDSIPESVFPAPRRYADVDLVIAEPTRQATWSTTVWRRRPDGGWRTSGAGASDSVVRLDADLGTGALTVTDSSGEKQASTVVMQPAVPASAP